jgi:probable phosphoglycerate mutase
MTFSEVAEQHRDGLDEWLGSLDASPGGGESFREVEQRVLGGLQRLLDAHGGKTVVVVSHVTPIKTLLRMALDAPPSALYRMHLDLACLSNVQWFADGPAVVRSMNETHYLASVTPGE